MTLPRQRAPGAPLEQVVIVGSNRTAWLAAIALRRAFGRTGLAVTVVETPSVRPRDAVLATLPDLARFHKLLGMDEDALFRRAGAGFALGQQFAGWSGGEATFLHAYGDSGHPIRGLPFLHFWTRARARGLAVPFEQFNATAIGASHDRLLMRADGGDYGYLLDESAYERLLRDTARAMDVRIVADARPVPLVDGGNVTALALSDGSTLNGDLFVDASGPGALVMSALPEADDFASASPHCDHMLITSAAPLNPLPLYSRISTHRAGWLGLFPLASRTGVALAFASAYMSDADARAELANAVGIEAALNASSTALHDRWRLRPWVGNCVALGEAAAMGDPLDAVDLQRDQIGIAHLLTLFPIDRHHMPEASLFNELVVAHFDRLRDFQAAHYRLNGRSEPFWQAARACAGGETLHARLGLFEARGMVAQHNHDSFTTESWQTVLVGHGLVPRSYDPQIDAVPDGEVAQELQGMLRSVRTAVAAMMPHPAARRAVVAR